MATSSPALQPTKVLGRSVTLWIKTIVWSAVCAFMITVGVMGHGDCELSPRLPTLLLVTGILHLAIILLQMIFLTEVPVNWQELQEDEDAEPKAHPMKVAVSLLGMGGILLYILGIIWTYPKASDYFEDPGATCNPWVFIPIFVLTTVFSWALVVSCIFVCLSPFIMSLIVRRVEKQNAQAASADGAVADNV